MVSGTADLVVWLDICEGSQLASLSSWKDMISPIVMIALRGLLLPIQILGAATGGLGEHLPRSISLPVSVRTLELYVSGFTK